FLGKKPELRRDQRQDRGNIHEAGVVGDEYVTRLRIDLRQSLGAYANEADGKEDPGPRARDLVRNASTGIEQGRQQRQRAHHDGRQGDQRRRNEHRAQIAHRFAPIITARASATRKSDPVTKIASGRRRRATARAAWTLGAVETPAISAMVTGERAR